MANGKTRVNYNPKTQNLPGTSMAVLARALQLIARRDARLRELPESQPCGLISSSSTNFWSQAGTASSTSLTTSKENTSSKSSYSGKSSSSRTPAPASDEAQKSKKRKVSPSIYQQEVARQKRERQKRTIPQYSVDTTSPRSTAISSRSPSPTDTMTPAEAKELISTAVGTQRRHEVYHGTILPEEELELPIIANRRSNASFPDDDPARYCAKSTDSIQSSKRRKTNGLSAYPVSPSDDERPVVKSFPNIFLSKTQLAAEKQDCHYCQLEAFSTHSDYPVTIENKMLDEATLPSDFRFIERPHFGNGVARCDPNFRAGCDCNKASACGGPSCECHNPDQGDMPYELKGPKKGCLKRKFFRSTLAIFECHDSCLNCINKDCPNRVVDNGRKIPLTIFRTTDGRGWGVKSTVDIRAGQFVDKYVGEILTPRAANHRRQTADRAARKDIYLFALDKFEEEESDNGQKREILEVDGEFFGGPTRFINHSCDPNLRIFARVGDESEKHIHDLAFFAVKDIEAGTELTFDYVAGETVEDRLDGLDERAKAETKGDMAECLCGSARCRGFLW